MRQETPKTCCMASPSVSLGKEMEVEWSRAAGGGRLGLTV